MANIINRKFFGGFKLTAVFLLSLSLVSLMGCETFKQKFIRKHKGEVGEGEEKSVVFEPQEYPSQPYSNDELYQDYYQLWKSWKQELSESLDFSLGSLEPWMNNKKQIANSKEMVANLEAMKSLLVEEQQKGLEKLIQKAKNMSDKISAGNLNANDLYILKSDLETLERNIRKDYTYNKVKKFIKK